MTEEMLTSAEHCAKFALQDLQALHRKAAWIDALFFLPLITKQQEIVNALKAFREAKS